MDAEEALKTLNGRLWHTTSEPRFQGIRKARAILHAPSVADVAENERWGTACGPSGWPYVRTLGGVSLFDFAGFDPEAYEEKCPSSNWREFVPFRDDWGASVWIEIDRERVAPNLVGGGDLLERCNRDRAHRHRLMPYIEACHLGDVPKGVFVRALVVRRGDSQFKPLVI